MSGFIQLLSSGANGLLTLEGQNTTCADVFYVWVCIAYRLEEVLSSPDIGLTDLRGAVIQVYNHRFNQVMTESSHEIFLLAYYLHPSRLITKSLAMKLEIAYHYFFQRFVIMEPCS
jgi:hypothetical protein